MNQMSDRHLLMHLRRVDQRRSFAKLVTTVKQTALCQDLKAAV